MKSLGLEIRKLRRKHYWLMVFCALAFQVLWLGAALGRRATGPAGTRLLALGINDAFNLAVLMLPIVAAVLASRLVTIDVEGGMDQMFSALGQGEAGRFFAKLVLGGSTMAVMEVGIVAFATVVGDGLGLHPTPGSSGALPVASVVLVAASFAAVAVQLSLARLFEKQGVGLGVATVFAIAASGLGFMGMQRWGWLVPWGIGAAGNPIDQVASQHRTGDVTLVESSTFNAVMAVTMALVWTVAARLVLVWKEHRS